MLQPRWTPKPVGSILDPAENPYAPPLDPNNQMDVMHYQEAEARDESFRKNELAAQDYLDFFWNTWFRDYDSGRMIGPTGIMGDPDVAPPQPPHGFKVLVVREEDGSIGYDTEVRIGPPVCAVPNYAKKPMPQNVAAAQQQGLTVQSANEAASNKSGKARR